MSDANRDELQRLVKQCQDALQGITRWQSIADQQAATMDAQAAEFEKTRRAHAEAMKQAANMAVLVREVAAQAQETLRLDGGE